MPTEFTLPELGENIEKGDVVRVLVAPGDEIRKDQPVLELETDKATIEVPSDVAGRVSDVRVKAGDRISVGQVVLVVDSSAAAPEEAGAAEAAPPQAAGPAVPEPDAAGSRTENVVDISSARPPAPSRAEPPAAAAAAPVPAVAEAERLVPAAPSVRRFARELGVDLAEVSGTGPGGRIGQEDVTQHVKARMTRTPGPVPGSPVAPPLPDFARWGEVEVQPMSSIRRKTAEHLSHAWQAPHVTQHDRADVTALEAFRATHGKRVEQAGGKLTVTAIVIKLVAAAIDRFPHFASSVDLANEAVVVKRYRHIGVAVDTPKGLLVPVIRDVDRKSLTEIAIELATLSGKARDRKLTLDEMSGGVFSVTNLGGIGGTSFTPIVNYPEAAILGLSRTSLEPIWHEGQFVPRQMLPLSLSYDHRVIDGADAARFLRFLVEALEQPFTMYL